MPNLHAGRLMRRLAAPLVVLTVAAPALAEWARWSIFNSAAGADGVRVADGNGDGRRDLIVPWEQSGYATVHLQPAGCTAAHGQWPTMILNNVPYAEDAIFVDLDGDGLSEIVTATEGLGQSVLVHWPDPDFSEYFNPNSWSRTTLPTPSLRWLVVTPMQIDGQHGPDLLLGAKRTGPGAALVDLAWLQAPADPTDMGGWKYWPLGVVGWAMSIETLDMDADGDLDVLLSDRDPISGGVRWFENPGPQSETLREPWAVWNISTEQRDAMFIEVVDLDGDGFDDIIVPDLPHALYWYEKLDPTGRKWEEHRIYLPTDAGEVKGVRAGDLDLDGDLDLVMTFSHAEPPLFGVTWLLNQGNPASPSWPMLDISGTAGTKFDRIVVFDVEEDGDLDIITTEENNNGQGFALGVVMYINPKFNYAWADITGDLAVDFADLIWVVDTFGATGGHLVADIDGDGDVDFADLGYILGCFGADCTAGVPGQPTGPNHHGG